VADRSRDSSLIDGGTLTKGEYERYRNGSTPALKRCEVCSGPLADEQKRTCSSKCRSALASAASVKARRTAAKRKPTSEPSSSSSPVPTSLVELLESMPPEVDAIELHGWTCRRV
jgi:hypothetical protein